MSFRSLLFPLGLVATALVGSVLVSTSADAQQSYDGSGRWMTVDNNSSQTIISIHAVRPPRTPETTDPNLIPGYTIPPGGSTRFWIDTRRLGCVLNIRLRSSLYPQRPDWMLY